MDHKLPERLNLAIGNTCYVNCPGCYQVFGNNAPQLKKILQSVVRFTELGVRKVTISGGDPLLVGKIIPFLKDLKALGIEDIKLDTVGLGLLQPLKTGVDRRLNIEKTQKFFSLLSTLGLPLDGWDSTSLKKFRIGRKELFDEILFLLDALSSWSAQKWVVINTVAHAHNIVELEKIHAHLSQFCIIKEWHIFQYTPTDQVSMRTNSNYAITDETFFAAKENLLARKKNPLENFSTHFYSNSDRLGWYLLINSDGNAWLPGQSGQTINLGSVYGKESTVLERWSYERCRCNLAITA